MIGLSLLVMLFVASVSFKPLPGDDESPALLNGRVCFDAMMPARSVPTVPARPATLDWLRRSRDVEPLDGDAGPRTATIASPLPCGGQRRGSRQGSRSMPAGATTSKIIAGSCRTRRLTTSRSSTSGCGRRPRTPRRRTRRDSLLNSTTASTTRQAPAGLGHEPSSVLRSLIPLIDVRRSARRLQLLLHRRSTRQRIGALGRHSGQHHHHGVLHPQHASQGHDRSAAGQADPALGAAALQVCRRPDVHLPEHAFAIVGIWLVLGLRSGIWANWLSAHDLRATRSSSPFSMPSRRCSAC